MLALLRPISKKGRKRSFMSNLKYIPDYPVGKIIPYSHNPRRNDRSVEPIMKSIQMAGFINPIIIDTHNIVLAGHARLEAVKRLGNDTVGVIIADIAPDAAKAYRITDNKTSEYARWDDDMLREELKELQNLGIELDQMSFNEIEQMMIFDVDEPETHSPAQTTPSATSSASPVVKPLAPTGSNSMPQRNTYSSYEEAAKEGMNMSYNVIIGCLSEEEQEWLKSLFREDGRLKRFYNCQELMERFGE